METELYKMIQSLLGRVENKVDNVCEKLDNYSQECTRERAEFNGRLTSLEATRTDNKEEKKELKSRIWGIVEKIIMYGLATYFGAKEVFANL